MDEKTPSIFMAPTRWHVFFSNRRDVIAVIQGDYLWQGFFLIFPWICLMFGAWKFWKIMLRNCWLFHGDESHGIESVKKKHRKNTSKTQELWQEPSPS